MSNLLLVEDSLGDAELLRLRAAGARGGGITLEVVESLADGIAAAQARCFDAVLLDLGLPDSLGLETVSQFRRAVPRVPVIIFTGLDDLETAVSALRVGADDYLVKGELTSETLRRSVSYAVERRKLLEESRRAVETRDEIMRIVSHDMRNQLSSVLAGVGLLKQEEDPQKRTRRLEQVERAAQTMRRLIGDLLDIGALENGALQISPVSCTSHELLQAAFVNFAPATERRGMRLELRPAAADVRLLCDRERIVQVLGNFISNALKFTPPGGTLTLACEVETGQVRMSVQDTGPGIAEAETERVFERFFRGAHSRGAGLGLGLTIARALVEAHRGSIGVSSKPGEGARFWFTLPSA